MRKRSLWKIPSVLAVFGLTLALALAGCDGSGSPAERGVNGPGGGGGTGGGTGGGGAGMGSSLNLSGQVWLSCCCFDYELVEFTESRNVSAGFQGGDCCCDGIWIDVGGSGSITSGALSFNIVGSPSELESISAIFGEFGTLFTNFQISAPNARAVIIYSLRTSGGGYYAWLFREWFEESDTSVAFKSVAYVYVDRNVIITGRGGPVEWSCDCWDCDCIIWEGYCDCAGTAIIQDLNLNLSAGWNAIHISEGATYSNGVWNMAISPGDPTHFWWVLAGGPAAAASLDRSGRALPGRADARSPFRARR